MDRAMTVLEIDAGMGRLAGHIHHHEDATLTAGDDIAARPPWLCIVDRTRPARRLLFEQAQA